ncbi:MAG: hypothetical protein ACREUC_23550, partial [Steroidobacteraceae bacterium]
RMLSAALILVLLAVAGSLASWLFGQWSSRGWQPTVTLAVAGAGALLLTGTAAITIIAATSGWKPFMPIVDALRRDVGGSAEQKPFPNAPTQDDEAEIAAAGGLEQWLESLRHKAQRSFEIEEYEQAVEFADQFVKLRPYDADIRALRAHSFQAVGRAVDAQREMDVAMMLALGEGKVVPASWFFAGPSAAPSASEDWPATDCMKPVRIAEAGRWFLDNECQGVVGVVFASCRESQATCNQDALASAGWMYEPAGIVMTSMTQKPVWHRLAARGPLIASTYGVEESGAMRLKIGYLACFVTAPEALGLLDAASQTESDEILQARLAGALRSDECYSKVLKWSGAGKRDGRSPDALLRTGVD